MKMLLIAGAALPILGLGGGYLAGTQLSAPADVPEMHAADSNPAEAPKIDLFAEASATTAPKPTKPTAIPDKSAMADAAVPTKASLKSENVVRLGSITVPVYRAKSVTYVVADFGVSMSDSATAAHYRIAENSARLRDTILTSFRAAAENTKMKRVTMDSDWLSATITEDVRGKFDEAQEVLFLSLYKQDVPRS
jgi:hypothetical protein